MKKITLKKQIIVGVLLAFLIASISVSSTFLRDYIIDKKYEFEPQSYTWNFANISLLSSQIEERSEKILYFIGKVIYRENITIYNPYTNETRYEISNILFRYFYDDTYAYSIWHDSKKIEWQFKLNSLSPTAKQEPNFVTDTNSFKTIISALTDDLIQTQNWKSTYGEINAFPEDWTVLGFSYSLHFVFADGSSFEFCIQDNEIKFYYLLYYDYYVHGDGSSGWRIDWDVPHVCYMGNSTGLFPQHTNAINEIIIQHST